MYLYLAVIIVCVPAPQTWSLFVVVKKSQPGSGSNRATVFPRAPNYGDCEHRAADTATDSGNHRDNQ